VDGCAPADTVRAWSSSTERLGLISLNRPSADRSLPSWISFTTSAGLSDGSSAMSFAARFVTLGAAIDVPDHLSRSPPGM
jgi:hypothetical protein